MTAPWQPCSPVVHGDCLSVLAGWPDESVDLAYLDPPFNTGQRQGDGETGFDDRWDDIDAFMEFVKPRLLEVHRVLRMSGSILLHCDWRTSHHMRLALDQAFGADRFVNHLIWRYGLGGSSPRRFARKHDDILFYGKGPNYYFDPPRVAATSRRMRGQTKKATDVLDVPSINNMAAERTGYPTQKPVALLKLLIGACSPPGGMVIDPFCGSGTTLVAARQLGRDHVGIDVSAAAVEIARRRCGRPAALPA